MNYKRQIIRGYVDRMEQEPKYSKPSSHYSDAVGRMAKIDLAHFNDGDMGEKIIRPYLYKWGKMQRVLGHKEFKGWEIKIPKLIRSNQKLLNEFRSKRLTDTKITEFKADIVACYDSFKKVIGKTAASKVLHLICSDFFPLWDTKISEAFKKESADKIHKDFSGADYYKFMLWVKKFMREYDDVLTEGNGKTTLKVLDDFLWALANRPLMIFED